MMPQASTSAVTSGEEMVIAQQAAVPLTSPKVETAPGVIYFHGRGQTGQGLHGSVLKKAFVDRGFRLVSPLLNSSVNWGSAAALAQVIPARELVESYGVAPGEPVILAAESMGCYSALQWAKNNPTEVACVVMNIPSIALRWRHDNNQGDAAVTTEIMAAHGSLAAIDAADPEQFADDLLGIPMGLWQTDNDPFFPVARAEAFCAASGAVRFSTGAVGGHDPTLTDPDDVGDWAMTHI